jgi:stage IV sporulation protein FB
MPNCPLSAVAIESRQVPRLSSARRGIFFGHGMSDRLPALFASFPLGRLFQTQVRVSVFYPAVALVFLIRFEWRLALVLTAIFFVSTLIHEFGHVLAARLTGGIADEILLWPLGGLAMVQPAPRLSAQLTTIFAGPLANLLVCLLTFPGFHAPERLWGVLNPFELPVGTWDAATWMPDLLLLTFSLNWLLLLLNLLPVFPLDGGQALQAVLAAQMPGEGVLRWSNTVNLVCGSLLFVTGLAWGWTWVLALGAILLILNLAIGSAHGMADGYDDSFLGYDFSQGYTSLEKSDGGSARPGWVEQWKERRRIERETREMQQRFELEQQLDVLLAKVHEGGLQSLTAAEKRLLRRASEELRDRAKKPSADE